MFCFTRQFQPQNDGEHVPAISLANHREKDYYHVSQHKTCIQAVELLGTTETPKIVK